MLGHETVRRIAAALPGATDKTEGERLVFTVGGQGFAWSALQRLRPKTPRVPNPRVLAVRCPMERKEFLIEAAPDIYCDDDHYRGWPAVLVRLDAIEEDELAALLTDACAWQASQPRRKRKP
jgi:hypothetical protein